MLAWNLGISCLSVYLIQTRRKMLLKQVVLKMNTGFLTKLIYMSIRNNQNHPFFDPKRFDISAKFWPIFFIFVLTSS